MAAAVEAQVVPQPRRAVGVAAELVARQELAVLVAFVRLDHRAADIDQADARASASADRGSGACRRCAAARSPAASICAASARARNAAGHGWSHYDAAADGRGDRAVGRIADLVIDDESTLADLDRRRPDLDRYRRRGTRAGSGYGLRSPGRLRPAARCARGPRPRLMPAGEPTPRGRTRCRTGRSNGRFHRTARCSRRW